MRYLLDTDHISIIQRRIGPEFARLSERIFVHDPADFAFGMVSFHEQTSGGHAFINQARTPDEVVRGYLMLGRILESFAEVTVLPFDAGAALAFDRLSPQRLRVGTMDLRIAAIAQSRDLTLLTRNVADFGKVPGLRTEDWTR